MFAAWIGGGMFVLGLVVLCFSAKWSGIARVGDRGEIIWKIQPGCFLLRLLAATLCVCGLVIGTVSLPNRRHEGVPRTSSAVRALSGPVPISDLKGET